MTRTVNIAELKNRLSRYLDEVRQGSEILIRDRNRPIAKIVPLAATDDFDAEEQALIASGQIRPPRNPGPLPASVWKMAGPRVSAKKVVAALIADRDER